MLNILLINDFKFLNRDAQRLQAVIGYYFWSRKMAISALGTGKFMG